MQSKITIGSGEIFGRGLFQGVYHRYDYLPVQESDFIFAVLGEELGFIGGAIVIFLYFMFLGRLLESLKSKRYIRNLSCYRYCLYVCFSDYREYWYDHGHDACNGGYITLLELRW